MFTEQELAQVEQTNHELACALYFAQHVLLDDNATLEAQNNILAAKGQELLPVPDPEKFPSVELDFSLRQAMDIRNRAVTGRASVQEVVRGILDLAPLNEEAVVEPEAVDDGLETGTVIEVSFDKEVLDYYKFIASQRDVTPEVLLTNTVVNFLTAESAQ